jgi:AcrR family transcriptional regulator
VAPVRAVGPTIDEAFPRKRASSLPPEERRSMIIAATLRLLLEQGEMATSHDIAAAAGIAEGTIFRVFASKDDLLQAVVDRLFDPEPIEAAIAAIDVHQNLEKVVTEVVGLLQQRVVDIWKLMSVVGGRFHDHQRRAPVESPALVRLFDAHRDDLLVKPAQAAQSLRSFTLAMTHPMITAEPVRPVEVARRFLYGVAGRPC